MSEITGVFEVAAGHVVDITADTDGLTPDQIATLLYEGDPGIRICHQCAEDINDPESGELVSFSVDGVLYERDGDGWKVVGSAAAVSGVTPK